ncbi:MAG: DNA recombination protein RmuC [Actinobacteria bacterium]|nr:DNA recombination protein RmuC [Actinomycetota bacterium]MBI3688016.1 DNA recombination protein RmuC [Actinomycetota bacterium]
MAEQLAAVRAELARAEAALDHERAATKEKLALLDAGEQRLRETFDALSAQALRRNNEQFVALAEGRFAEVQTAARGDLAQRQQAIEGLVAPLRESLARVEGQIQAVEKDRVGAHEALLAQVGTMRQASDQLRLETAQLVTALRAPQVRGRWGELQLQRVVEAAGMVEHCDFVQQQTATSDDGAHRPDLIVQLAGGKQIIVDAKVAFGGYLEAMEARDEPTRAERLKAHARHLKMHVDALAAKAYWERFAPTPEFVVCFVPADAFLNAALEQDPSLLEHAFGRNIVIATPSTLIALLRTVAYTWRQESLTRNALEVHRLARDLYGRLATMGGHLEAMGRSLNTAVGKYNSAVSSLESRVLVTARKLNEMGVVDGELEAPRQVETLARSVQAPVLLSGDVTLIGNGTREVLP